MLRVGSVEEALMRLDGVKAVVFDMDDTLYPETDYVLSGYRQVADYLKEQYKIRGAFGKLKTLFKEDKSGVFDRFIKTEKLLCEKDGVLAELLGVYRNQTPDITLYPSVKRTLKVLRKKGYKIGIITDGDAVRQREKAAALGLEKYVDGATFSGDFGEDVKKPSPVLFNDICKKLCVSPDEIIYIGDNPKKDFAVKKELPVFTLKVGGGLYEKSEYLFGVKPDFAVDGPLYGKRRKRL